MTTVVPIAKFKLNDAVMYLEATMDGDVCLGSVVIATAVQERVFTTEMGWMYFLKGRHGYFKEELLREYNEEEAKETAEKEAWTGFIADVINPDTLPKVTFNVGDYACCQEDGITELLMVIGILWEPVDEEFSYDCALLDEKGNFITIQRGYYEDELEPIPKEDMEEVRRKLINPRPRPTLAYSR